MPTVKVYNMAGQQTGEMELNAAVFGIEPNVPAMHAAVKNYLANCRQGTQSTLTRSEVRGGGIKPWRQKGTGRARQGSIRAPQWIHGGIALGPKPRTYRYSLNKKLKRLAMLSALSAKAQAGEIIVVDKFDFEAPSTKAAVAALKALDVKGRSTVIIGDDDINAFLSFRNIKSVTVIPVAFMNTYDFLDNKKLVVTSEALARIEEVLA